MKAAAIARPAEAAADWTIPQDWRLYTADEHALWDELFARQSALALGRVTPAFLEGLDILRLSKPGIPDFDELNARLHRRTGWTVVAVPGLVPDDVFFEHLANRRFVAGRFLRTRAQIDYLQEPDIFHDVFGHVPLLADPVFADYMQAYGEGGLQALGRGQLHHLARLYWYTVEFGLVETPAGLRIYGAGIASSAAESRYALESPKPLRLGFDLARVMRTPYRIDDFQEVYFAVPSLRALLDATLADFDQLYARLAALPDLRLGFVEPTDRVLQTPQ